MWTEPDARPSAWRSRRARPEDRPARSRRRPRGCRLGQRPGDSEPAQRAPRRAHGGEADAVTTGDDDVDGFGRRGHRHHLVGVRLVDPVGPPVVGVIDVHGGRTVPIEAYVPETAPGPLPQLLLD